MRIQRYGIATDTSDMQILTYINNARHEVEKIFLPMYPEHFAKVYRIPLDVTMFYPRYDHPNTYSGIPVKILETTLPAEVIDITVAILEWRKTSDQVLYRSEARQVTKYELSSVSGHTWNIPTLMTPIYALDKYVVREGVNDAYLTKLYLAGIDTTLTTSLFDVSDFVRLELWCTIALPYIESIDIDDIDTAMPLEGMELTITLAILRLLADLHEQEAVTILQAEYQRSLTQIKDNYATWTTIVPSLYPSKEGAS